jgi:hypothetical protein
METPPRLCSRHANRCGGLYHIYQCVHGLTRSELVRTAEGNSANLVLAVLAFVDIVFLQTAPGAEIYRPLILAVVRRMLHVFFNVDANTQKSQIFRLNICAARATLLGMSTAVVATGMRSWEAVLIALVFDWILTYGTNVYSFLRFERNVNDARLRKTFLKRSNSRLSETVAKRPLMRRLFDGPILVFVRWMGVRAGPSPEMTVLELRAFEFILTCQQLTVSYLTMVLLYPITLALNDTGMEHVLSALFPLGFQSLVYLMVLFANDVLQDILAYMVVVSHSGIRMTKYFGSCCSKDFWMLLLSANFLTPLLCAQLCAILWAAKKTRAVCPWMDDCQ